MTKAKQAILSPRELVPPILTAIVVVLALLLANVDGLLVALITLGAVVIAALLIPVVAYLRAYLTADRVCYSVAQAKIAELEAEIENLNNRTGTLIPPGWNAIISGSQQGDGEWIPPGYRVIMDAGPVSDGATGNSVSGGDARIYGGTGNTVMGYGSRIGVRPWAN